MNIPEEFGSYLLLKKLTEDPLGETFRAGKAGKEGLEQVVLLRVLNGKGMDGERLWQKISGRAAVQQALKSPNIATGVDLGRVRNYPYTAYDYVSGKNLATILAQAERQMSPVPADHALLIAERVSLALSVAYESRVGDERVLHGFAVPHLVMVSNEGEAKVLGFEIAPGLRELAATGWRDADLLRYVAPEATSPGPVSRADDVWSLGAILYELLTSEHLPAAGPDGYASVIDQAMVANDGTPFPPAIAALLKKSLVPRAERIGDAGQWHKMLSKLMIDERYSPTTFNLAFFMHNLFREDFDREGQEIAAEKKLNLTTRAASTAVTMAIPVMAPGKGGVEAREQTGAHPMPIAPPPAAPAQSGGNKGLLGVVAALLVAVLAGGGWYFLKGPGAGTGAAAPPPPVATAALPAPAATNDAAAIAARQEELQKQIAAMVEARSKEMEANLQGKYSDKIKDLQKQLEDTRKAEARQSAVPAPSRPEPTPEPRPAPRVEPTPEKEVVAAVPPPVPAPKVEPAAPAPAPRPAPPREPEVKVGDLVQNGPGVVTPQVVGRPEPRFPSAGRKLNRSATIDLKVLVDERGNVIQAELTGARVGLGFDDAAIEAARRSTFRPATKDGVKVKMWTQLRVTFKPQ